MKNNYIILILFLFNTLGFSQGYEFGIVQIADYNFKVVAIPDFDSAGNTDVSDVGFTLMMPAGSVDITNQTGLLGGRAWTLTQFDAATLAGLGGDGTEDGFQFNLPAGQTLLAHTNGQQIDLVSFDVTNTPITGQMRFLLNSETIATNAGGALDSFYNSNIDATTTQDYFSGIASGLGSFDFSTLSIKDAETLLGISVYPNPTKGKLYLNGDTSKLKDIHIYSMTGQHVMKVKDNFREINIESLQAAIYFVKLNTTDAAGTYKIVKE